MASTYTSFLTPAIALCKAYYLCYLSLSSQQLEERQADYSYIHFTNKEKQGNEHTCPRPYSSNISSTQKSGTLICD